MPCRVCGLTSRSSRPVTGSSRTAALASAIARNLSYAWHHDRNRHNGIVDPAVCRWAQPAAVSGHYLPVLGLCSTVEYSLCLQHAHGHGAHDERFTVCRLGFPSHAAPAAAAGLVGVLLGVPAHSVASTSADAAIAADSRGGIRGPGLSGHDRRANDPWCPGMAGHVDETCVGSLARPVLPLAVAGERGQLSADLRIRARAHHGLGAVHAFSK